VDGDERRADGRVEAYLARVTPEVVAVTVAVVPAPQPARQSVTIRFSGRRLGVGGKAGPGDRFVQDETVDDILAGGGPVAITAKVSGVNPGEWEVSATLRPISGAERVSRARAAPRSAAPQHVYSAAWSWRRWRLTEATPKAVTTCPAVLARVPGVIIGSWAVLSVLGIVAALVTQHLVISADQLKIRHVLPVSLASIGAGVIGAKLWYVALHRRARRWAGWCIQGLVLGIAIVTPALLAVTHNPISTFFDASAPGLLVGMGIGRLGCFSSGCCCGRPTASRWGVWSSDRRPVGARRIPTQLIESGFALAVGGTVGVGVLSHGPARGAWFASGLAAYTIGRQGILQLRDERKSTQAGIIAAGVAGVVLALGAGLLALGAV